LARGAANASTKLTESKVLEIRRIYGNGEATQRALARRFGVTQSVIGNIVRRELWKHVGALEGREMGRNDDQTG
jgi:uncharacterized protein (DUF2336 family)